MALTIEALQLERRWVVWRLVPRPDGTFTKEPFSPKGYKASIKDPANWHTYAELEPIIHKFSGVGLVLGDLNGTCSYVWGTDIDKCCDAASGKFTPESREVVIGLNSYTEYSPSGTGCHVFGVGGRVPVSSKGEVLVRPYPGAKQIEIKGAGFYFTFSGRYIPKTPAALMDRGEQLQALIDRVSAIETPHKPGLIVSVSLSEEDRYKKLIAGDMSDYNDDHSRADFALCVILAKKHGCNAFKVDEAFRDSGLYREDKWEREDYSQGTITRAIMAVAKETPAILAGPSEEDMDEDGETEFLIDGSEADRDGWFPKGEVSLFGGPSGVGKTSLLMPMLEDIRLGRDVWGHKIPKPRDYRILLHDRSKKGTARTAKALNLGAEAKDRIIRLTPEQQRMQPADALQACIESSPGVEVWLTEGLDMWFQDANKMSMVAPTLDSLQRVATRYKVVLLATVGAPKQKGKDRYYGRDALFGSSALARKVETIVNVSFHDQQDPNSAREVWVLPRTAKAEVLYFDLVGGRPIQRGKPDEEPDQDMLLLSRAIEMFPEGTPVVHKPSFGSDSTFQRWRKRMVGRKFIVKSAKQYFIAARGCTVKSD